MSEFADRARNIQHSTETMLEAARAESAILLGQMDEAESKFEEQLPTQDRPPRPETVKMQEAEIDRISIDYQDKIDRRDVEIAALRSRLSAKEKDFSALARAVGDINDLGEAPSPPPARTPSTSSTATRDGRQDRHAAPRSPAAAGSAV